MKILYNRKEAPRRFGRMGAFLYRGLAGAP
nr:MAG TPA: hypothetical protein [Caudoviricetes sp.]